jgi:predicted aconitase with swiveling domain
MKLKGRIINGGDVHGEAFVLDEPFAFLGEFDFETGEVTIPGNPLFGKSMANKILVCPSGKGSTLAPFLVYRAWKKGKAPAAILCEKADTVLCESALTIDIPILDSFDASPVKNIRTGQFITVHEGEVTVADKLPTL